MYKLASFFHSAGDSGLCVSAVTNVQVSATLVLQWKQVSRYRKYTRIIQSHPKLYLNKLAKRERGREREAR